MIKNFINRLIKKSIIFHLFLFCFLVESAVVFGANKSKKNIFREESGMEKSDVKKNNTNKKGIMDKEEMVEDNTDKDGKNNVEKIGGEKDKVKASNEKIMGNDDVKKGENKGNLNKSSVNKDGVDTNDIDKNNMNKGNVDKVGVDKNSVDKGVMDKGDIEKNGENKSHKNNASKNDTNENDTETDEIEKYASKNGVVDEKKNNIKSSNTINIVSKNDFTILANVDKIAITKYDLNNFAIMMKNSANAGNKNSRVISNKEYNKYLDDYINILKKRIIAEKSGVNLSEEEKNNLWGMFSKNLNTTLDLDKYCEKNNLDKDFVIYFLESNFLWYRYVESFLKQNISVDNETIDSVLEFIMKEQYLVRYDLSEIVLYFNNKEQKVAVLEKLNNIHNSLNSKNFGITAFSMSQASSAKNNGLLGWLYENELNGEIIKSLTNARKGSIIKPFCVGEEAGACFIFMVNDREKNVEISEGERNSVAQFIERKILEEKIGDVIHGTKINVMINYD